MCIASNIILINGTSSLNVLPSMVQRGSDFAKFSQHNEKGVKSTGEQESKGSIYIGTVTHLPFDPRSSGTVQPCSVAQASKSLSITPASHVTMELCSSNRSTLFIAPSSKTTSPCGVVPPGTTVGDCIGTPPPTKPVLPPCGTTDKPSLLQ